MLSLAKLSNMRARKLASAKYTADPAAGDQREMIENGLTLITAQRILQEDTERGDEMALSQSDLVKLACEKIESARDVDEIRRFAICGLSIASANPVSQKEEIAEDACAIWNAVINADIHTWKSVAMEDGMAVGGMPEEELIRRVEGTAFVGVIYDFVTTAPSGESMKNVGYLNDHVRNQVSLSLGSVSDELAKVLLLSAKIAYATN